MKPEAQRMAIATHFGWKWGNGIWTDPEGRTRAFTDIIIGKEMGPYVNPPFYPNDLNACHEMENSLGADQQIQYTNHLMEMVKSRHWTHAPFDRIHATAAQRVEAFLRTIGEWNDEE